jgi:hypothetical protein
MNALSGRHKVLPLAKGEPRGLKLRPPAPILHCLGLARVAPLGLRASVELTAGQMIDAILLRVSGREIALDRVRDGTTHALRRDARAGIRGLRGNRRSHEQQSSQGEPWLSVARFFRREPYVPLTALHSRPMAPPPPTWLDERGRPLAKRPCLRRGVRFRCSRSQPSQLRF